MHYLMSLEFCKHRYGEVRAGCLLILIEPRREKTCLRWFTNNTGADQPAHTRSLISAFIIRLMESIISRLATNEISFF